MDEASSSHGSSGRVEDFSGLGRRYGGMLRQPGIFSESELALLDEWRRTADSGALAEAAGVPGPRGKKSVDEKLTAIASRGAQLVPELAGVKRDRQLAALVAILETKTYQRGDGSRFVARSSESFPDPGASTVRPQRGISLSPPRSPAEAGNVHPRARQPSRTSPPCVTLRAQLG